MSAFIGLAFLAQVVRISIPYALAALGGTFSERGGVPNIALEGILLLAAFAFVLGAWVTGDPWVGALAGVAGGVVTASLLAVATIRFGAEPIVSGIAINLLAMGLTRYLLKLTWDSSSNSARVVTPDPLWTPDGPLSAAANLLTQPLAWVAAGALLLSHGLLFRTRFGLRLRACGEHPEAAASVGIPVRSIRAGGVLLSGVLAGLAGVWLAAEQHQFTDNMTGGRGYIALAAVIFGKWHPLRAAAACLLFGAAEALQIHLQARGTGIPPQFLQMLPYVLTLVALVGFMGRATAPAASGRPYEGP